MQQHSTVCLAILVALHDRFTVVVNGSFAVYSHTGQGAPNDLDCIIVGADEGMITVHCAKIAKTYNVEFYGRAFWCNQQKLVDLNIIRGEAKHRLLQEQKSARMQIAESCQHLGMQERAAD